MATVTNVNFHDFGIGNPKTHLYVVLRIKDASDGLILKWRTEGIQTEPSSGESETSYGTRTKKSFCPQFQTLAAGSGRIVVSVPGILEETAFRFTALELGKAIERISTTTSSSTNFSTLFANVWLQDKEEIPDENTRLSWRLGGETGQEICNEDGCFTLIKEIPAGNGHVVVSIPGILEEAVIEFTALPMDQPDTQEAATASPASVVVEEDPPVPVISLDQASDNQNPLEFGVTPPDLVEETADETPARVIVAGNGTILPEAGNVTEQSPPVRIRLLETAAPAKPPDSHPDDDLPHDDYFTSETPASDNRRDSLNPASLDEAQRHGENMIKKLRPSFVIPVVEVGREVAVSVFVPLSADSDFNNECFLGWRIEGIDADIVEKRVVYGEVISDESIEYEVRFTPKKVSSGRLVVWVSGYIDDTPVEIEVKPTPASSASALASKPAPTSSVPETASKPTPASTPASKPTPTSSASAPASKPAPTSSVPAPASPASAPASKPAPAPKWPLSKVRGFSFVVAILVAVLGLAGLTIIWNMVDIDKTSVSEHPTPPPVMGTVVPAGETITPEAAATEAPVSETPPVLETTPAFDDCVITRSWQVTMDGQTAWIAKCDNDQLVFCTSSTEFNGQFALDPADASACAPAPLPPSGS